MNRKTVKEKDGINDEYIMKIEETQGGFIKDD